MLSRQEELVERREVLENDKRVREQGSTFMLHTHNDLGGRYAAISSPVVVGTEPIPKYPAAFLQHDPVPDEPPLNVDVNALEPCGESFEIQRSHELKASITELSAPGSGSLQSQAPTPPAPDTPMAKSQRSLRTLAFLAPSMAGANRLLLGLSRIFSMLIG